MKTIIKAALTTLTFAGILKFLQVGFEYCGQKDLARLFNWESLANSGGALLFVGLTLFFYFYSRDILYSTLIASIFVGIVMYFILPSFTIFMAMVFVLSLVLIFMRESSTSY